MYKEIEDLIKSNQNEIEINGQYIIKEEYKNIISLYEQDYENGSLNDICKIYLLSYNKDTLEIIHVAQNNHKNAGISYDEAKKINKYYFNLEEIAKKEANDFFDKNISKLIKEFDVNEYKEMAKKIYKERRKMVEKPNINCKLDLTKNILNKIVTDKEAFEKEFKKQIIEQNKTNVIKFTMIKKACEIYKEELTKDPLYYYKEKLIEIIKNIANNKENFTEIKISYTHPNNTVGTTSINCASFHYNRLYNEIMYNNRLVVPIKSIETITNCDEILYKKSILEEIEYPLEEKINDFCEINYIDELPKEYYDNPIFMKNLILTNIRNSSYLSSRLKMDTDYIYDLLMSIKHKSVLLENVNPIIFTNNTFCKNCINYLLDTNSNITIILSNCNKEIFDDFEFFMKIYQKLENKDVEVLLKNTNMHILENKNFIEKVKEIEMNDKDLFFKITNVDLLVKLYGFQQIYDNIDDINPILLDTETFIEYLLDNVPNDEYNHNCFTILEEYRDNFEIVKKLACKIPENKIRNFLIVAEITDKDKILELASVNINFITALKEDIQLAYLECVISDYINIETTEPLKIITETGTFSFASPYDITIKFTDLNNNIYTTDNVKGIFAALREELEIRYPKKTPEEITHLLFNKEDPTI